MTVQGGSKTALLTCGHIEPSPGPCPLGMQPLAVTLLMLLLSLSMGPLTTGVGLRPRIRVHSRQARVVRERMRTRGGA